MESVELVCELSDGLASVGALSDLTLVCSGFEDDVVEGCRLSLSLVLIDEVCAELWDDSVDVI